MTQSIDIPGSIAKIEQLVQAKAPRVQVVKVADRCFLVDQDKGAHTEIVPRFEDVAPKAPCVRVRDLASLIAWTEGTGAAGGQVLIGATGQTRAVSPLMAQPHQERVEALMTFFDDYLPRGTWQSYVDFIGWIDLVKPFMAAADAKVIDLALESLEAKQEESQGLTVRNAGANLNVETTGAKKSEIGGKFPKYIEATIPYGDPNFRTPVKFSVTMRLEGKTLEVKVVHHPEPATSAWIEWSRAIVAGGLPDGWSVLVGP